MPPDRAAFPWRRPLPFPPRRSPLDDRMAAATAPSDEQPTTTTTTTTTSTTMTTTMLNPIDCEWITPNS